MAQTNQIAQKETDQSQKMERRKEIIRLGGGKIVDGAFPCYVYSTERGVLTPVASEFYRAPFRGRYHLYEVYENEELYVVCFDFRTCCVRFDDNSLDEIVIVDPERSYVFVRYCRGSKCVKKVEVPLKALPEDLSIKSYSRYDDLWKIMLSNIKDNISIFPSLFNSGYHVTYYRTY